MDKKKQSAGVIAAVVIAIIASASVNRRLSQHERPAAPPAATVQAAGQAPVNALLALPELKAWSAWIEKDTHGKAHGAVIGGDAEPKQVDGKTYQAYSFVENDPERVQRLQGFYVTADGAHILVEDDISGALLTVDEWRKRDKPLERIGSQPAQ